MTFSQNKTGIRNVIAGIRNAGKLEELPLSADLQDGYEEPEQIGRELVTLGVVGGNIEDQNNRRGELFGIDEACERIKKLLKGAKEAGVDDFVVNARTDVLGFGWTIDDVIARGKRFLEYRLCMGRRKT